MKKIILVLSALMCALLIPAAMALGPSGHNDGKHGNGDWLNPNFGSTVIKYTSTGHTFHAANYNPGTGITTFVNPTGYINSQLYSQPLQTSDGSIVLYGYNSYYPLGYNQLSGKYYFYGTQAYFDDYASNDPWYRTVALPFLRNTYGIAPGYSNMVFVSNPAVTYSYSSYVHYGGYGDWLGFV